jgi:aspartyl-tRNA(Asn)/glutamyl-tRNA(Gln) amidotransferase subunit B
MNLESVIGLEFHVQLKTKSKMFCSCKNDSDNAKPNENICPICMGHPGTLPTVNENAITMAIRAGLALNCHIAKFTKFDRKNYFYPDLSKGYQISQYDKPIATHGFLVINNLAADGLAGRLDDEKQLKRIGITRLHMEEDTGKSVHSKNTTLLDYNRCGAPLIEIVTEPDLSSPQEAKTFGQEMQLIMKHLGISDAEMENGQLRCDANISLRPKGETKLYTKIEIKNINSFRTLERALTFEINRQTILWKENNAPTVQETRGWDENKQETVLQRTKEEAHDYRYFPEPDLPPLTFTDNQITEQEALLPELPQDKRRRFMELYGFTGEEAKIICENKDLANYAEQIISELKDWLKTVDEGAAEEIWEKNKKKLIKLVSNWLINKFVPFTAENKIKFADNKITAENFAEFIKLVYESKVNSTAAQTILQEMILTGGDPSHIIDDKDLGQMESSDELKDILEKIIILKPAQVADFKSGKEPIIKYLIGLGMRETKGKANPQEIEKIFRELLQ